MPVFPRYRFQALTEAQSQAIAGSLAAGVQPSVLASAYGVSVRTIYRVRHREGQTIVTLEAGPWAGRFALTPDGPVQVEPWLPRPEALD